MYTPSTKGTLYDMCAHFVLAREQKYVSANKRNKIDTVRTPRTLRQAQTDPLATDGYEYYSDS